MQYFHIILMMEEGIKQHHHPQGPLRGPMALKMQYIFRVAFIVALPIGGRTVDGGARTQAYLNVAARFMSIPNWERHDGVMMLVAPPV